MDRHHTMTPSAATALPMPTPQRVPAAGRGPGTPARRLAVSAGMLVALTTAVLSAAVRPGSADAPAATALRPSGPGRTVPEPTAGSLMTRFALNALLATLIDDDAPPRWTDVAVKHICGPATRVEVDGRPMVPGARIPATAFSVRWQLDQCQPFEAGSVVLDGSVELLVFHEDNGLGAVVHAQRMTASDATGTTQWRAPFAASLSLAADPAAVLPGPTGRSIGRTAAPEETGSRQGGLQQKLAAAGGMGTCTRSTARTAGRPSRSTRPATPTS